MDSSRQPHRRAMLTGGLAVAAAAVLPGCAKGTGEGPGRAEGAGKAAAADLKATPAAPSPSPPPRPATPKEALARLLEGNKRWAGGHLRHPGREPDRRQFAAQAQEPYAVVLSCLDCRVPPELLFDTGLGDLYVLRTGAQATGPVVTGSVQYGPMTTGTPLIVVLGHQRCGAAKAAYDALRDGATLPGNLQAIADAVQPAYKKTLKYRGPDPADVMVRAQAELTAAELRSGKDLSPLVKKGALAVVSAYYSLDTGRAEILSGAP
ncbi:carbonic anhydrase [Streptomyces sp. URMC 127]|uniref:carbonic anhydrase n=1 Tax=Streptomyces sp. URMC 127 TaxID=3423402 RepID=UPI003F1AA95B